jgi:hypothetical protein
MSSSTETVNSLMLWLNQTFGLSLPLLPLRGWTAPVISLWNAALDWVPGGSPLPLSVKVEGNWKPFDSADFELEDITIDINPCE